MTACLTTPVSDNVMQRAYCHVLLTAASQLDQRDRQWHHHSLLQRLICRTTYTSAHCSILPYHETWLKLKVKVKVWTLVIALLTWVRLVTSSSALQSRKWQPMVPQRILWPSIARVNGQLQLADRPSPQSATLGLHAVTHNRWGTTHFPSRWG